MQTFIISHNMAENATILDRQRLGKQRVEALQIASNLIIAPDHWANHPAVRMWKGYERFLLSNYSLSVIREWNKRGYNGVSCEVKLVSLIKVVMDRDPLMEEYPLTRPPWITDEFILSHRSNLIRKKPEYYQPLWPDVPDNLPYIWPVK